MLAKQAELELQEQDNERMLKISNKHYRRYYEDELENWKDLCCDKVFENVPITRGQQRGLKKSLLSDLFKKKKEDESGEISTKKVVGYFKGRVRCYNEQDAKK
jgi:hypothetical protein